MITKSIKITIILSLVFFFEDSSSKAVELPDDEPIYKVSADYDPPAHSYRPQIAYNDTAQEYLVVWHSTWDNGDRYVYARRLDSDGSPLGSAFALSTLLVDQVHPNVIYNHTDDVYMVVWMKDVSGTNSRYHIVGSIIPWNASGPGTVFPIGTTIGMPNLWYPTVAWNSGHNEYLVIWDTFVEGNPKGDPTYIGYRRVDDDGTLLESEGTISSYLKPTASDMVYNPAADEYFIVWSRLKASSETEREIVGARLDWEMNFNRSEFCVYCVETDNVDEPAIDVDNGDYYGVAFEREMVSADPFVSAKFLDQNGDGIALSSIGVPTAEIRNPDVAAIRQTDDWLITFQVNHPIFGKYVKSSQYKLTEPGNVSYIKDISTVWTGGTYRTPAVTGSEGSFQMVFEGRSDATDSRQHIYTQSFVPINIYLPLVIK